MHISGLSVSFCRVATHLEIRGSCGTSGNWKGQRVSGESWGILLDMLPRYLAIEHNPHPNPCPCVVCVRRRVDSLHWAVWHCQAEEPSRTWTLCGLGGPPLSWTLTLTHVCVYITLTLVCVWSVYDVRRWRVDSLHWAVWQCQAEEPSRTSTWTLCCLDTPPLSSRREARIFTSRLTTSTNISRYSDELQTYSISCSRELQFCWAAEQGDVGTSAGLSLTTSLETFLEAGFSRSNAHSLLRTSLIWDFTVVTGYFLYRLQFSAWHNSA